METHLNLSDKLIIAPASMARIHAGQTPAEMLDIFMCKLFPYVTEPTNDAIVLGTRELYLNNDSKELTPHDLHKKTLRQQLEFAIKFAKLQATTEEKINAAGVSFRANNIKLQSWSEAQLQLAEDFLSAMDKLHAEYKQRPNGRFAQAVRKDLENMRRAETPAHVAFLVEEVADTYARFANQDKLHRSMSSENRNVVIAYPGQPLVSLGEGLRHLRLKEQALFIDVSRQDNIGAIDLRKAA